MYKRKVNITRINKKEKIDESDTVLIETPIDIYINSNPLVNVVCLPESLEELAIGFAFSIGIINNYNDVKTLEVNELEGNINIDLIDSINFDLDKFEMDPVSRVIDTTCGIPSPWRKYIKETLEKSKEAITSSKTKKLSSEVIFNSIIKMQTKTELFRETGGCHGAALFDYQGNILSVKEDIGRHNAIDKVIGEMVIKNHGFENIFLTTTGRLTGDSVLKAIRARIPIVASLSAAIESGIRLAFAYGITLIGFVRGGRMNIYSHPERVEII
ncbi:MAG: formate dehydrogenase accessory sulfurtransferase FdhD [Candidatus Heimdallarchaeota archaeon]